MTMTAAPDRHLVSARHAGLDFALQLPAGFGLELPAQPRAGAGDAWVELARARPVAVTGDDARVRIVVAGLARAGVGSLEQAMLAQLRHRRPERGDLRALRVGRHVGLALHVRTGTRGAPLQVRLALAEDGGRLLRLMLAAPAGHPVLERQVWEPLAASLRLQHALGATLPVLQPGILRSHAAAETFETRRRRA